MKKYILISLCLLTAAGSFAQNKDFKFKFYGQIRTDFYYRTSNLRELPYGSRNICRKVLPERAKNT